MTEEAIVGRPTDSRIWQRAAVLGSLWAAIEIVVGSFLHNLSIPFAGSVLAAFGVTIATAGHRVWPDRGLIWRSALICALMKSISPSAVILGPMVGIMMEGLLLEAGLAILGANAAGYVVGGALAVSWSSAQKILSALMAFGPDVVRLYVEAYNHASRSLGVAGSGFGPFDLVATLFILEALIGAVAATVGLRLARRRTAKPAATGSQVNVRAGTGPRATDAVGTWSIPRLAAFAAGLVGGMLLLSRLPLPIGAALVAAYAVLVFRAYPRAMVRLRRPMFWLQLAGVLVLAGLLLGGLRNGSAGLLLGFHAGTQMALRAILVLLGFTAVSVELRNPRILGWLERRRLRGLSDALGLAFGALPAFTAMLADQRTFWRQPLSTLGRMLDTADSFYVPRPAGSGSIVILTGATGSGKTTRAGEVVDLLRRRGCKVGGILARGLLTGNRRSGFDLVDLSTGHTIAWCREGAGSAHPEQRWGRFEFTHEGLEFGRAALAVGYPAPDVMVLDEVGPLELAGGGWAESLDRLVERFHGSIMVVARLAVVEAVRTRWGAATTPVYDVARDAPEVIAGVLLECRAAARAAD